MNDVDINGSGTLVNGNVTPINLDLSLIPLVHEYLNGATIDQCADSFNLNKLQVSEFLNRREVKQYIANTLKNSGYAAKQRRLDLLSRIVDQKIELAEENELPLSNKDLLEVLKALREEENDINKLSTDFEEDTGKAQYINIINSLKAD